MSINIRNKGQTGEREIADILNFIVYSVMKEKNFPEEECLKGISRIQRNQNQSAVGGNDLTDCFGLSIEVKRQEQLAVSTWWTQCIAAANRNNEMPVLIYRQNRKAWRVRAIGMVGGVSGVVEFDIEMFKEIFKRRVTLWLERD
jgi:hypothetical protein